MLPQISLSVGLIGIIATTGLVQMTTIAKSSVEFADTTRTIDTAIARSKKPGFRDYFTSAEQKYKNGDYQGALADYNLAIKSNPKSANAHYNRALIKAIQLKDYQGALADYNRAINLKPNYDSAYNNRGSLKTDHLQDYQGALVDYNRAISLNPQNANAYYNRGLLKHAFLKDRTGGIADLQQAAKLFKSKGNNEDYQAATDLLTSWQQTSGN